MNFRPVLIEKEDKANCEVLASSAILVEDKYILTTCSPLNNNILRENIELLRGVEPGKLHFCRRKNLVTTFHVLWQSDDDDELFTVKTAKLFGLFKCKNLTEFYRNDFKDWSVDFREHNLNLTESVAVFLILAIEGGQDIGEENLKSTLRSWLSEASSVNVKKCDRIRCLSSPFGSKEFLNSISEGIVSTSLKGSTLYLSDCSTAPGSEGGPVYLKNNHLDLPIGIVISSFNWWRRDWVGFTLIADIRPLIRQLVGSDDNMQINSYGTSLAFFERCLAQVKCGSYWGTCILLSKENGIFLTNAHVVCQGLRISLFWQNQLATARLIYKTPDDDAYDLAVLRCDDCWPSMSPADLRVTPYEVGDSVYCAGYPLLSTSARPDSPTVTHGVLSASGRYMIKTVCGVYPGFSGGGVFSANGVLLGIIVSNIKLGDGNITYPKCNMAIPFKAVSDIIFKFLENGDRSVLSQLRTSNGNAQAIWKKLESKL